MSPFFAEKIIKLTTSLFEQHMVVLLCDKIDKKVGQFDLDLLLMQSEYPSLFVLMGDDKSVTHVVSTLGPWLFDSNLPNAQKINWEVLDWCVSSPEINQKCVDIYWGIRLIPKPPKSSTFKQGENKYCAHESLAIILDLLGEHLAASEMVTLSPKHLYNKDWFLGMFDFFQKKRFYQIYLFEKEIDCTTLLFRSNWWHYCYVY